MEDIATLAGFLQLEPLHSRSLFEKYVLKPLSEPAIDSVPLRAYMQAYCIRRSEACLRLPASREEVVSLSLSPPEREVYDDILKNARRQIDDMVSTGNNSRCAHLFTALLRLRMVCNTGTFRPDEGGQSLLTTQPLAKRSDALINQCERCSATDGDTVMLLSTCGICPDCMRPLHQRYSSPLPYTTSHLQGSPMSSNNTGFSTKLEAVARNVACASMSGNKA